MKLKELLKLDEPAAKIALAILGQSLTFRAVAEGTGAGEGSPFDADALTGSLEEKKQYSEIVKNLSESLGVFLTMLSDLAPYGYDEDDEDDEI